MPALRANRTNQQVMPGRIVTHPGSNTVDPSGTTGGAGMCKGQARAPELGRITCLLTGPRW
jgi:hypothetical protein